MAFRTHPFYVVLSVTHPWLLIPLYAFWIMTSQYYTLVIRFVHEWAESPNESNIAHVYLCNNIIYIHTLWQTACALRWNCVGRRFRCCFHSCCYPINIIYALLAGGISTFSAKLETKAKTCRHSSGNHILATGDVISSQHIIHYYH